MDTNTAREVVREYRVDEAAQRMRYYTKSELYRVLAVTTDAATIVAARRVLNVWHGVPYEGETR